MLTAKREKFAQAIAAGNSQADAYRLAYCAEKMGAPAVWVESGRLASNPAVALRIAELRAPAVEKARITLESHLQRLKELSEGAEAAEQYSAAVKAEESRGKASGLYVDKLQIAGDAKGAPIAVQNVPLFDSTKLDQVEREQFQQLLLKGAYAVRGAG